MGRAAFSRGDRLATTIRRELAEMIGERQIKEFRDSAFDGLISITDVRVKNGYQHVDISLSIMGESSKERVLEILTAAISQIRGELCRRLKLRFAPTIAFHLDESIERGCKMWGILDQLAGSDLSSEQSSESSNRAL
ncbi:MAG: 30S ribosome-binding factor RbfA [Candidatus Caenarcaniphilales bacterium]|nr:30S ribosome-binding factor RbfA [Candidatus Caenarcaniphilales bacterium]